MVTYGYLIEKLETDYDPYNNNSNTLVDEILSKAGLKEPELDNELASPGSRDPEATDPRCFGEGTPILMTDGTKKPIEQVEAGDWVMSFDPAEDHGRGKLVPGRVTRTFRGWSKHMLDFHGTRVTPGHLYLRGDGPHEGRFQKILDILRDDGAIVREDGSLIRAATNAPVGSREDQFVQVIYAVDVEQLKRGIHYEGRMRAGTLLLQPDGTAITVLKAMEGGGYELLPDGRVLKQGLDPAPLHWFGELPKPETYVLKRSGLTLADLYGDDGEDARPLPSAPPAMRPGAPGERQPVLQASAPRAEPPASNRRERRRNAALRRRSAPLHAGDIVH